MPYNRTLQNGDIVTFDVTGYNGGIHSDLAETFCIGNVDRDNRKLVETTRTCLYKAISICKPGTLYRNIGLIITKIATENGFTVVNNLGGHTIGKYLHMMPFVSNHVNYSTERMKQGDMFTIEPILCVDDGDFIIDQDNFSIRTKNGKNAAHFERTILITKSGHEILNEIKK